jgi:hypothetical protein
MLKRQIIRAGLIQKNDLWGNICENFTYSQIEMNLLKKKSAVAIMEKVTIGW